MNKIYSGYKFLFQARNLIQQLWQVRVEEINIAKEKSAIRGRIDASSGDNICFYQAFAFNKLSKFYNLLVFILCNNLLQNNYYNW